MKVLGWITAICIAISAGSYFLYKHGNAKTQLANAQQTLQQLESRNSASKQKLETAIQGVTMKIKLTKDELNSYEGSVTPEQMAALQAERRELLAKRSSLQAQLSNQ